jgi:plasmid stabilization system protein ParE
MMRDSRPRVESPQRFAGVAAQSSTGEVITRRPAGRTSSGSVIPGRDRRCRRDHDLLRADRAQHEFDAIVEHLTSALGLGGSARTAGASSERARSAVTKRIRASIERIAEVHPELGRHLDASIETGTFCCYRPERTIDWTT